MPRTPKNMYFIFYTWADGCDEEEVAESSRVEVENIKLIGSNNRDKDLNEKKARLQY